MTEEFKKAVEEVSSIGIRELLISSYEIPKYFYQTGMGKPRKNKSSAALMKELGVLCWYSTTVCKTRKKRTFMDIELMVVRWHKMIVGLAVAHTKDAADAVEASVEECLSPMLNAPVKQLREFAPKLLHTLQNDAGVPYLVWRSFEIWVEMMKGAPDDGVKELKKDLAAQIVDMVEADAKAQLPEAMIRALMWRSPEKLQEVKEVVEREKAAGRGVRLKGRESCLFLEAGGSDEEPTVCVQI
jgi:hypothetical protein